MKVVGEPKVAVLCPSRGRPDALAKMVASVRETSRADVLAYVDTDWADQYRDVEGIKLTIGPRIGVVASANRLVAKNPGYDIYGLFTDDTKILTPSWDRWLQNVFSEYPLAVAAPMHNLGDVLDMPFVSRHWIEVVGWYACPVFYHWCWPAIHGLIGEMTTIVHAGRDDFRLDHWSIGGGVHTSHTERREQDNNHFFDYINLELMKKVYAIREAMACVGT